MAGNPGGPLFSELYSHPACADSISALAFDPCQEIVWCGSQQGRLTSFLFPGLERYSACQAHVSDVRGLLPDAGGVVSISADTVRYHDRGCVLRLQHTFSVGEGVGLQAFTIADPNRWHLALGGDFGKLLLFDLNSSRILNQTEVDISTTSMKLTRAIVCGTSTGALQLRDPRNLRLEATLEGHSGPVLDMDVRGNLIVTCGLSLRGEQFFSDPLIRVTDVRTLRTLYRIPFPAGAHRLSFHPVFSSALLAVSATGLLQTCDVQAGGANAVFSQVNLMGEELTAMGLGTAGQVLGFTDSAGYLHVWADRDEPTLNLYSAETPIVPAFPSPPLVPCTEDGPFSLVPLPVPLGGPYLSELPSSMLCETRPSRRGLPLPPHLLAQVKQVEFVGYLQNPGLFRRNSRAASRPSTQTGAEDDRPAHLSSSRRPSFDLAGTPDHEAVPKRFRRVEIKLNKLGVDDFDFGYYNKTCFSGLENSLPNSFVNSLLQLLFFLRPLRVAILNHLCNVPICLACELAFLFHMMERSNGANCQASNFLRCFQQITQVARLGLLEPSDSPLSALNPGTLPVGRRLHSLARFLLEHVSKELDGQPPSTQHLPKPLAPTIRGSPHGSPSPSPPVSPAKGNRRSAAGQPALPDPAPSPHGNVIDKLLGFSSRTCSRCPQGHNTIRESRAFVIDLQLRAIEGASDANTSFARLLESTLHVETDASRAWCDQCGSYQRMSVTRMVTSLPNAFAMNCAAKGPTPGPMPPWMRPAPASVMAAAAAAEGEGGGAMHAEDCNHAADAWLPLRIRIRRQTSGTMAVDEIRPGMEAVASGPSATAVSSLQAVQGGNPDCGAGEGAGEGVGAAHAEEAVEYELTGVVSLILDDMAAATGQGTRTGGTGSISGPVAAAVPNAADPRFYNDGHLIAHIRAGWAVADASLAQSADPSVLGQASENVESGDDDVEAGQPSSVEQSASGSHRTRTSDWFLFNDFVVQAASASEAVRFSRPWRVPCLFLYTRVHLEQVVQLPPRISPLNSAPFERDSIPPGVPPNIPRPFKSVPQRMIPGEGSICAIDCEFVALSQQEEEVRADGSRNVVKPSRMGLARVSVVRGDGAREGEILIDDYILNTEPVVDYLTRFSGLHPGDLDPSRSRHHLIALKDAYVKLRYLVDRGVRLVGHGLKKDFRTINIFVPPDQIIDTVELFSLRRQRKISLKFLAAFLLHIDIQSGSHDSVEDARTALALYRKYQQLCADGEFEDTLDEIYRQGRRCNWTLTAEALATLQHPAEPAGTSTPGPPMAIPIPSGKHSSLMPPPPPSAKHAS